MRGLLACLVIAGFAGPAGACLNDIELPLHEREFRSQYRSNQPAQPTPAAEPSRSPGNPLLYGAGGFLVLGAAALASMGRAARV
jgi:hypothetical protein